MKNDIQKYTSALEEEKKVLVKELSGLGIFDKAKNDWEATPGGEGMVAEADENDKADQFEEYEERSATLSTLETRFQAVTKALEKIEKGNYGMCETCGKPIEEDRLGANPAATTCIAHMQ